MIDKRALRARLRAARDAAPRAGGVVVGAAFRERAWAGMILASYVPVGSEADPAPLARIAVEAGAMLALPHVVDRATPLRFLAWKSEAALTAGPFGLRQPAIGAGEVTPDVILTPMVGFDRRGNRIGQGAGHYDRAFAAYPDAWRIGVAWSVQEVAEFDPDPWDVSLHAIATEQEWITP